MPCVICGRPDPFPLSMGGPNICPPCDCGYTASPQLYEALRQENERIRSDIEALRSPASQPQPETKAGREFFARLLRTEADRRERIGESYQDTAPDTAQDEFVWAAAFRAGAAALTAPAASPADQGWQPIETAPKDGAVLGWFPYHASPAEGGQVFVMRFNDDKYSTRPRPRPYWDASGWVWGVRDLRKRQPTHWMPLPPAPLARVPQDQEPVR